jgi:competence protein ComEC
MVILSFNHKRSLVLSLLLGYFVLMAAYMELPDGKNHLYFFNIGQGDSVFFNSKDNYQILIDGGPNSLVLERLSEVMPFFDKSIDLVVLSHPHKDHLDGLIAVIDHYQISNIILTGVNHHSDSYDELLRRLNTRVDIKVWFAYAEFDFTLGGTFLDIIYPDRSLLLMNSDNLNNSSIVLKLITDEVSILLTGDIELEVETYLVGKNIDLEADILKIPHHGSKSSSTYPFLKKVSPLFAVIQSGINNQFDHPHNETMRKLESIKGLKILRNDVDGMVEFSW